MPPAGEMPANRAMAHLRWAERYSDLGEARKANSHVVRGLDYVRLSAGFGAPAQPKFSNIEEMNADHGWYVAELDGGSVDITMRKTDEGHTTVYAQHETGVRASIRITVIQVQGDVSYMTLRVIDPLVLRVHQGFEDDMRILHEAAKNNAKDKRIACVIIRNAYGSYPGEEPERIRTGMRLTEAVVAFLKERRVVSDESLVVVRAADESESDELLRRKLEGNGYKPLGYYMMVRKARSTGTRSTGTRSRSSTARVPQTRSQDRSRTRSGSNLKRK
ncbi:MAG: hypothetical protein EBZ77_08230 [Chitinophagia bacterium]|nr:hypothetical protein [Chitinophagia bacterium]